MKYTTKIKRKVDKVLRSLYAVCVSELNSDVNLFALVYYVPVIYGRVYIGNLAFVERYAALLY